jgi:hypothetical protein
MDSKWQLYTSQHGWRVVEERLDTALEVTFAEHKPSGMAAAARKAAASKAFLAMIRVMDLPENSRFGASDSEPFDYLATRISAHYDVRINRWGDIATRG